MPGKPIRIQRKRTKGWRMPEGAVYVGRPTRWGNPFHTAIAYRDALSLPLQGVLACTREEVRQELRGRSLACWCGPDRACHADVLLEIANAE